jgi:hypothetical protein
VDFGLQVQRLPKGTDRVLVLGQYSGTHTGDGWFTPSSVTAAFEAFRLPAPVNVSQALAQLRNRGLVIRRAGGGDWSLTPLGREHILDLMGNVGAAEQAAAAAAPVGAEFGHAVHTLIPPFFAPLKWGPAIRRFLEDFDFDRNVFCMTRFPDATADAGDPISRVIAAVRDVMSKHGLTLHLASDRSIDDDLWGNVAAHGWACRYGIALFESRSARGLNYNLVAEVGAMLMTGRRCAFLRDRTQETMPTDFVGQIYRSVDFDDVDGVRKSVKEWVINDLGLGA